MKSEHYQTEIREVFDSQYVKVFIDDLAYIEAVKSAILLLNSVKNVNITDSASTNNLSKTLTVYQKKPFSAQEVEKNIHAVLDFFFAGTEQNTKEIAEVRQVLTKHPKVLDVYDSAIQKIEKGEYDRNAIDDLRLAWDKLICDLTGRQASPNKQEHEIGLLLESKGVVPEMRNLFITLVKKYAEYQDTNVKHDINISHEDVLLVFNITNAFIKRIMSAN